jgi:signal peptidase II
MRLGAWGRVALVAAGVVALDQATKALVRATVGPGERVHVLPGVEIVHARNSGVAFGALSGGGAVVTVVVAAALVALLAYFATHVQRPLFWLPTGLLVGGAIGNVIDRVRAGEVTDFIQIPLGFPAFNVADMSITFGVVVLLLVIERHDARTRER